ncbi:MAG: glycosyltransferase [Desulfovibrionales bacterium]
MCPDKGVHLAVQAALEAGKKLIIAGNVYESHSDYFEQMIKPFIDDQRILYVGEVGFAKKIELYQGAAATLFPIQWNEPTGAVMFESMACGTPVIAFDRAAVREIIKNGTSGLVVADGNAKAMAAAVPRALELDRHNVRQWAENNFSSDKWAKKFEDICGKLVIKD